MATIGWEFEKATNGRLSFKLDTATSNSRPCLSAFPTLQLAFLCHAFRQNSYLYRGLKQAPRWSRWLGPRWAPETRVVRQPEKVSISSASWVTCFPYRKYKWKKKGSRRWRPGLRPCRYVTPKCFSVLPISTDALSSASVRYIAAHHSNVENNGLRQPLLGQSVTKSTRMKPMRMVVVVWMVETLMTELE